MAREPLFQFDWSVADCQEISSYLRSLEALGVMKVCAESKTLEQFSDSLSAHDWASRRNLARFRGLGCLVEQVKLANKAKSGTF